MGIDTRSPHEALADWKAPDTASDVSKDIKAQLAKKREDLAYYKREANWLKEEYEQGMLPTGHQPDYKDLSRRTELTSERIKLLQEEIRELEVEDKKQ